MSRLQQATASWWENPLYIIGRVFLCVTSAGMKMFHPTWFHIQLEVLSLRFSAESVWFAPS